MIDLGVLGEKEVEIGDEHSWDIHGAESFPPAFRWLHAAPASSGEGEKAVSKSHPLKLSMICFLLQVELINKTQIDADLFTAGCLGTVHRLLSLLCPHFPLSLPPPFCHPPHL